MTDFGQGLVQFALTAAGDVDLGAFGGEGLGDAQADPALAPVTTAILPSSLLLIFLRP